MSGELTQEQEKWLRYGLDGNPPGYSPHWDAIRALLAAYEERGQENVALRFGLWAMCPHDMKYGDDGEQQCRGMDFKHRSTEDILQHVVESLRAWSGRCADAAESKLAERDREIERFQKQIAQEIGPEFIALDLHRKALADLRQQLEAAQAQIRHMMDQDVADLEQKAQEASRE